MEPDRWTLYRQMLLSRRFEETVTELWEQGKISGEMHLGLGEEAIAVGVVAHLEEGDALALDHRGTPPIVARGVDLVLLLRELLGCEDGLCGGKGGHMHLFSKDHLIASSGIVGSACPMAVGFALANRQLRPGCIAVAFFGEGAMNQGMVMESFNLAAVWNLPVLFVCKDNDQAISTQSSSVTAGSVCERARSFGLRVLEVDGSDVEAVWQAAGEAVERARAGDGPGFLLAHCIHPEGHFLGDPLLRQVRRPLEQFKEHTAPMIGALIRPDGASLGERLGSLGVVASLLRKVTEEQVRSGRDPVDRLRRKLRTDRQRLEQVEREVSDEIQRVLSTALLAS